MWTWHVIGLLLLPAVLIGQERVTRPTLPLGSTLLIEPSSGSRVIGVLYRQTEDSLVIDQLRQKGRRYIATSDIKTIAIGSRSMGAGLLRTGIFATGFLFLNQANNSSSAKQDAAIGISTALVLNTVVWPDYKWQPVRW